MLRLQHKETAVKSAVDTLRRHPPDWSVPLNLDWLARPYEHPWPIWLDVCAAIASPEFGLPPGERARLLALITDPSLPLTLAANPEDVAKVHSSHRPLAAWEAAQLAVRLLNKGKAPGREPRTLTEHLIVSAWQGKDLALHRPDVKMVQLLVEQDGINHDGVLAQIELWALNPEVCIPESDRLVRAPGTSLLALDGDFASALDQVQALLDPTTGIVEAHAPTLAWSMRLIPHGKEASARSLHSVKGDSAGAALAYASLWLVRDHITDSFAAERAALRAALPHRITVTAALGRRMSGAGSSIWPALGPVGSADTKFGALRELPPGLREEVSHGYVSKDQQWNASFPPAEPAASLDELIHLVARDTGLSPDEQRLLDLLVSRDEPIEDIALLQRVANDTRPVDRIERYLLRQYARRAGGEQRPFGAPAQLDLSFVNLDLDPEPSAADAHRALGDDREGAPGIQRQPHYDLGQLLQGQEYAGVTAWILRAEPLAGKTTLLAQWEMRTAREALQRHARGEPWGEVCVFLPMRGLANEIEKKEHGGDVVAAFLAYAAKHAPGIPPLPEQLGDKPVVPGLKVRLLLDALNEVKAPSIAVRSELIRSICRWIAEHAPNRLPPVFSVRVREDGLDLRVEVGEGSRLIPRGVRLHGWTRPMMLQYIGKREAHAGSSADLSRLRELLVSTTSTEHAPDSFATFCSTPGHLAAMCTLALKYPKAQLPQRKGPLFLALLWHALDELRAEPDVAALLGEAIPLQLSLLEQRAEQGKWHLPSEPGLLLDQLIAQADAMQDSAGGATEQAVLADVPPGLLGPDKADLRERWLRAVRLMGLAQDDGEDWAFTHQQWQEFFAAVALTADAKLDLQPPPLAAEGEDALLQKLKDDQDFRLTLPPVPASAQRVSYSASMASPDRVRKWIRRLIPENLALAARVAIENRERLEPGPDPFASQKPDPLLQELRKRLLLRSVEAGSNVEDRVRASGALDAVGALADAEGAFVGRGVDVRRRIEAGLLLGDLGDTLRYESAPAAAASGLRLKAAHWLRVGAEPTAQDRLGLWRHQIGDAQGHADEKPVEVELGLFELARYPVTNGEWRRFVAAGGYDEGRAWWAEQGPAAQAYLHEHSKEEGAGKVRPFAWDEEYFNNDLQPVTGVRWWEAQAYVRWAAAMYERQVRANRSDPVAGRWKLVLPTEVQFEAAMRWKVRSPGRWPHPASEDGADGEPDALCFNHQKTAWWRPTPIGVFARGYTAQGVADGAGNTLEWMANVYRSEYDVSKGEWAGGPRAGRAATMSSRALRAGGYFYSADSCRVAHRSRGHPRSFFGGIGLRLACVWLPH